MAHTHPDPHEPAPKSGFRLNLTQQIVLGLIVGCLAGWWLGAHFNVDGLAKDDPVRTAILARKTDWLHWWEVPRDIFLHLIKAMIAPLIFASVVQGFAGTGDMKKAGRIGWKSLLYFEIVTTFALFVGLLVVNLVQPGAGVILTAEKAAAVVAKPPTPPEL